MRRLAWSLVAAGALVFAVAPLLGAKPADFCQRHPTNPNCAPAPTWTALPATTSPTASPTVAPTTSTPAPTVAPGRPFAPPVTTRTVTVPASVGDLTAFLATVPDGSVVEAPATGTYGALLIRGRANLVIDGNGATIRQSGTGSDQFSSAILVQASAHIAVSGFTVIGNNPDTTNIFVPGKENSHAVATGGWGGWGPSSYIEVSGLTASHLYGDFAYLEGRNIAPYEPSHHVWIHDNAGTWLGRNAVSGIDVTDVLVEGNSFDRVGMDALDLEPNFAAQQVRRLTFRTNSIGSYGHMSGFQGWLLNTWSPNLSPVTDITIDNNQVTGNPAGRFDGSPRALNTNVSHSQLTNIVFTNNRTSLAARGPVLVCDAGVHVTQSGNVQPLLSGSFTNCAP